MNDDQVFVLCLYVVTVAWILGKTWIAAWKDKGRR